MANGYLQKKALKERALVSATQGVMKQFLVDTLQITLHEEDGWGEQRLILLTEKWMETYDKYFQALGTGTEADYMRECLDGHLRGICYKHPEAVIPFETRYPELPDITYGRSK